MAFVTLLDSNALQRYLGSRRLAKLEAFGDRQKPRREITRRAGDVRLESGQQQRLASVVGRLSHRLSPAGGAVAPGEALHVQGKGSSHFCQPLCHQTALRVCGTPPTVIGAP